MTISRVQGATRGYNNSNGSTITVTLGTTPTQGNTLFAVIGTTQDTNGFVGVSSISQTGVTWTKQHQYQYQPSWYYNGEIWLGVVGSGASTSITINLLNVVTLRCAIADVMEYSGIASSSQLDTTATNDTRYSSTTDTGTTTATTQTDELWLGAIPCYGSAQGSASNGFTVLDGGTGQTCWNDAGTFYVGTFEKIVNGTGTANTNSGVSGTIYWIGLIATFKAASGYDPVIQGDTTIEGSLTVTGNSTFDGVITLPASNGYSTTIQSTTEGLMDTTQPSVKIKYNLLVEDITSYGFLGSNTDPGVPPNIPAKSTGGGAILIGHGLTDIWDPPRITLSDSIAAYIDKANHNGGTYNFDTLYVTLTDLYINPSTGNTDATITNITNWELGNMSFASIRHPFTAGTGGVTIGQIVALDSNGNVVPASFNTNGTAVIGIATQTQSAGNIVPVIIWGLARVGIDTEIFPGDRICASNVNAGRALAFNWHYHQLDVPSVPFSGNTAQVNTGLVIGKAITHGTPSSPGYVDMIVSISS